MKVFYRIGSFKEKKLFSSQKSYYDGIVINANILEFYAKATTELLVESEKPYIINPMTYLFMLEPSKLKSKDGKLKKSYSTLKDRYGKLSQEILGIRKIESKDFKTSNNLFNNEIIDDLIENVVSFQNNRVYATLPKLQKYAKMLDNEDIKNKYPETFRRLQLLCDSDFKPPYCIVPPYFPASTIQDPFYEISLYIAKRAINFKNKNYIYPVLAISKEMLLDDRALNKIIEDYSVPEFDGLLLWIVDFKDEKESEKSLFNLLKLVYNLKRNNIELINLYSGYYSVLLSYFGLDIVISNICYGASKQIELGGGPPPLTYYNSNICSKQSLEEASIYYNNHVDEICNCHICSSLRTSNSMALEDKISDFINGIDEENAKIHFMIKRWEEVKATNFNSIKDEIKRISDLYMKLKSEPESEILYSKIDHLQRWKRSLKAFIDYLDQN